MMSTDREKRDLRGSVQSVRNETAEFTRVEGNLVEQPWLVETETFDEQGRLMETTFHNTQHPEYSSKEVFSYDSTGKLIEQSFYHLDGRSGGKSVYLYDSDGRLLEVSSFDTDGKHTGKRVFSYHPNGDKAEELLFDYQELEPNADESYGVDANAGYDHCFSADGARLIKTIYDLQGSPKELQFLAENGKLLSKVIFATDAAGRIIKDAQYSSDGFLFDIPEGTEIPPEIAKLFGGDTPLSQSELIYDEEGRKIEDRMYFGDSLLMRRVFIYGTKGELVEDTTFEASGTQQSKARIECEYDSKDNWTKKIILSWREERNEFEPSIVYRRAFKYYA